ncbi:hypothetical protein [Streptomyces sudanensis]|uniref:hypothetical protein n=1 Tax=Streptomyces sudanensis TaxID=436397 RepID=UPI0020CF9F68|nr:hypothetical protein [Streptomyces sudanensis]MCP9956890.1 hypothetical protein [Streptomyces sudanensis]
MTLMRSADSGTGPAPVAVSSSVSSSISPSASSSMSSSNRSENGLLQPDASKVSSE